VVVPIVETAFISYSSASIHVSSQQPPLSQSCVAVLHSASHHPSPARIAFWKSEIVLYSNIGYKYVSSRQPIDIGGSSGRVNVSSFLSFSFNVWRTSVACFPFPEMRARYHHARSRSPSFSTAPKENYAVYHKLIKRSSSVYSRAFHLINKSLLSFIMLLC
jgi:hypothetical protein